MKISTKILALATAALLAAASAACKEEPPEDAEDSPPSEEAPAETEEESAPYLEVRQVYGLPLPPEVTDMRKGPHYVEVGTKLKLDELEGFFKSRLVDYEFIHANRNTIHVIGLRSAMPRITISRRNTLGPRRVRYKQQIGQTMREYLAENPVDRPRPGEKIETTLSNGKKLAPGAVYGEPYTPKPGDPLYSEGNRANFGKPFGKWVLN